MSELRKVVPFIFIKDVSGWFFSACLRPIAGVSTFHLPWATLEDENLVWAAHTFGLGHMGGQP